MNFEIRCGGETETVWSKHPSSSAEPKAKPQMRATAHMNVHPITLSRTAENSMGGRP